MVAGMLALTVLNAVIFWKADAIGRAVRLVDGGKLGRGDTAFGAGRGAYTMFVRMASGALFLMFGAVLVRAVLAL